MLQDIIRRINTLEDRGEALINSLNFSRLWLFKEDDDKKRDKKGRSCFKVTEISLAFALNILLALIEAGSGYYTLFAEPNANPKVLAALNLTIGLFATFSTISTTLLQGLAATTDSTKDLKKAIQLRKSITGPNVKTAATVLGKRGRRNVKTAELFTGCSLNSITAIASFALAIYIIIASENVNQKVVAATNLGLALFATIATLTSTYLNALGAKTDSEAMPPSQEGVRELLAQERTTQLREKLTLIQDTSKQMERLIESPIKDEERNGELEL